MAEVSLSLSAASAAMACVAPRPTTNRDEACASVAIASVAGGAADDESRTEGSFASAARSASSSLQWADERGAGDERGDHRLGRRDRALEAGAERQNRIRLARERRVFVVDEGDRQRALILRRPLHGEDVGASTRLRNGDRDRALELERRMIERGDRGPERSAGKPKLKLDEVLEIKRRMIGAAARDRRDEGRLQRP